VLSRIAQLPPDQRPLALQQLMILSGLRGLEEFVRKEAQHMPLEINLLENTVIGPALRQGMEQGMKQGMQEGRLSIIRRMLTHRFGQLPEWVEPRLSALSGERLEELSDRLLDARRLEDLF
jgi:predicted transposase YdaD